MYYYSYYFGLLYKVKYSCIIFCTLNVKILKLLTKSFDFSLLIYQCVHLNTIKIKYEMKD